MSSASLATQFDVSRRTIERDLAALRDAGVPLYGEQGRNGGMVSLDTGTGVVVSLSNAEVTALLVAVAASGPDMPFAADAGAATRRLIDGLASSTRSDVENLRSKVRYPTRPGAVSSRVRQTVEEAVRRGVVVNLTYRNGTGQRTERSVDAAGFFNGGDSWYLVGWCHLRQAGRLFRLDRIESARRTKRPVGDHDLDELLGWVPMEITIP